MRTFTAVAGIAFGLIFLAHIARLFAEGVELLTQPIFLVTSILAAGAAIWSFALLRRLR